MSETRPAELIASSRTVSYDRLMEAAEMAEDVAHSKITKWPELEKRNLLRCVSELRRIAETVK